MRRNRAFTLVELLVVIGIIAVLIGILLPTLTRAREAAQRTACLSNMRELGTMLRMYGTTYNDVIPIGFMDQKAFSYIMNWCNAGSSPPKPSQMGLLVTANLVKNPKTFYCPSETQDRQFMYQPNPSATVASDNPWPFWNTPATGKHTRLGYSARPVVNWPANLTALPNGKTITNKDKEYWLPIDGSSRIVLPRWSKLTGNAILADNNYTLAKVLQRHKRGINVLYGTGAAKWVDLKAIQDYGYPEPPATPQVRWKQLDENTAFDQGYNPMWLNDGTWPTGNAGGPGALLPKSKITGFWVMLDRQ